MSTRGIALPIVLGLAAWLPPCAPAAASEGTLSAFANDGELLEQWNAWQETLKKARQRRQRAPIPAPPAALPSEATALDSISVTGSRIAPADLVSITNVQTQGVDEGDIVKSSGDHLVILRRGRLFSVRIGDDRLQPVASIDAFAPGSDPSETWYDEMLLSGSTVLVIGYSYDRGGTEIGMFDLGDDGSLSYRATYHLRSNDYYSARNYASRLLGRTLIFYSPIPVDLDAPSPTASMAALRRWRRHGTPADFRRILPAQAIYRVPGTGPDGIVDLYELTLHTVNRCELGDGTMDCRATAVLGPEGRVFYVSQSAVYLWTAAWQHDSGEADASMLYRLPLDGSAPTALRTSGTPLDQMSFLERDGFINVLVGSEADGEGMWSSYSRAGELALMRVAIDRLGNGHEAAGSTDYQPLPGADIEQSWVSGRFIGDWLVYGSGESWSDAPPARRQAFALRYAERERPVAIGIGHDVERIDALGRDAILVGPAGPDLHFTSVRLDRSAAAVSSYVHPDSTQGDDRTHGFFYRPTDEEGGVVGLPALHFDDDGDSDGASVVYLRNRLLRLQGMGTLDAYGDAGRDDACMVSCVDWYGNARPIFIGDRVFALMGYELVEGRVQGQRVVERRRADFFLPPSAPAAQVVGD